MDDQEVNQETLNPEGEETATENAEGEDELVKAQEIAKNQKIRAEKAEAELKRLKAEAEAKRPEKETPKNKYSLDEIDDISALTSIPKEDRQEVMDYAERKGLKPSEALNAPFIKVYLKEQEEIRKTAQAANTGRSGHQLPPASDEQIIADAEAGKEVDPAKLAEARLQLKRARKL